MTPKFNIDLAFTSQSPMAHHGELTELPTAVLKTKRTLFHMEGDEVVMSVDNSSLESFLFCNRLAQYKLVNNRSSHPTAALTFGGIIHTGLEVYYKLKDTGLSRETLEDQCFSAMAISALEYPAVDPTDYRSLAFAQTVLGRYIDKYSKETDFAPLEIDGEKMIEYSFKSNLGHVNIDLSNTEFLAELNLPPEIKDLTSINVKLVWSGIIDMLVKETDGGVWLVDHKTTSMFGGDFFAQFEQSQQVIGYARAAQHIPNFRGFIVNALVCRKDTKTGKGTEFHRSRFTYDQEKIDEWETDVMAIVSEFLFNLQTSYFPKKTSWCLGKYGKCQFFDVCTSPINLREMVLHSNNYTDNVWKV